MVMIHEANKIRWAVVGLCFGLALAGTGQSMIRVATEIECTYGVRMLFMDGSCNSPDEPSDSSCQTLYGPGYVDFSVPSGSPILIAVSLHCASNDCTDNPVVFWDCYSGSTPGECCSQEVGLYGDQATGGFRVY